MAENSERVRVLASTDYVQMTWANGLGRTIELARVTEHDGRLLWRCSIADVVRPGPFSMFPGIDRALMLLSGDGFVFEIPPRPPCELRSPGQSVAFPGDVQSGTSQVFGPSKDLNVMTKRGSFTVAMRIISTGDQFRCLAGTQLLAHVEHGKWFVGIGDLETEISHSESMLCELRHDRNVLVSGTGLLAFVEISPSFKE